MFLSGSEVNWYRNTQKSWQKPWNTPKSAIFVSSPSSFGLGGGEINWQLSVTCIRLLLCTALWLSIVRSACVFAGVFVSWWETWITLWQIWSLKTFKYSDITIRRCLAGGASSLFPLCGWIFKDIGGQKIWTGSFRQRNWQTLWADPAKGRGISCAWKYYVGEKSWEGW